MEKGKIANKSHILCDEE